MLLPALLSISILSSPPAIQSKQGQAFAQSLLHQFTAPKFLKGLRVQLSATLPANPEKQAGIKQLSKATFSMGYPDHCRIEETLPGEGIRLYLWDGETLLLGPGGGPFVPVTGKARDRILDRFRLLAALFCWDLLPSSDPNEKTPRSDLRLKGKTLYSILGKKGDKSSIPIRRVFGPDQTLQLLVVGKKVYRPRGRLPGRRARLPKTLCSLSGPVFSIQHWAWGFDFKPTFFKPRSTRKRNQGLTHQGGEQENFAAPILKQLPPSFEIRVKDPGDWKARAQLLDKLGRQLFALGQEPAGLPLYGADGEIRIQFVPSEGNKPKAPRSFKIRKLKQRTALVLYQKGPFPKTMGSLEKKLRNKAKEMGIPKAGGFLVIPTYFPNPGGPFPDEKAPITMRGELLLEG